MYFIEENQYGQRFMGGKEFDFVHMKRRASASVADRELHRCHRDIKLWDGLVRNQGL